MTNSKAHILGLVSFCFVLKDNILMNVIFSYLKHDEHLVIWLYFENTNVIYIYIYTYIYIYIYIHIYIYLYQRHYYVYIYIYIKESVKLLYDNILTIYIYMITNMYICIYQLFMPWYHNVNKKKTFF